MHYGYAYDDDDDNDNVLQLCSDDDDDDEDDDDDVQSSHVHSCQKVHLHWSRSLCNRLNILNRLSLYSRTDVRKADF